MKKDEAISIIEIYKNELEQRVIGSMFCACLEEKDVYLYQAQAFEMAIEALKSMDDTDIETKDGEIRYTGENYIL